MTNAEIVNMIKRHEGYKNRVYRDSVGALTCGYGHAFLEGSFIPPEASRIFFEADFKTVLENYEALNFNLDPVRRAVVLSMLFNLGIGKFMGFKKMISAIRSGDFMSAKNEMLDSRWAKQVGNRAIELAAMMETGKTQ